MKNKLNYFISRASMFGIGFFLIFKHAGKDAWISIILGTLLGIIIIYAYKNIKDFFTYKKYNEVLKKTKLGKFYLFIFLLFYIYIMFILLILLPMFVNSFYLLYTPKIIIILPFLLIAIHLSFKGKSTLEPLSNLLFTFSIIFIFIIFILLSSYLKFTNLLPIYMTKNYNILTSSFIYASITSIPQIITINYNSNTFKDDLKNYLISSTINLLMILFIILSLGEPLIKIYSFPEYAVLKQIKLMDFIENVENIFTCIYYFDMFITISSLLTNIKDILPKKYNKITYFTIVLLTIYLSTFLVGGNYRLIITFFYSYPYILFIFFLIFITLLIYLKFQKKNIKFLF